MPSNTNMAYDCGVPKCIAYQFTANERELAPELVLTLEYDTVPEDYKPEDVIDFSLMAGDTPRQYRVMSVPNVYNYSSGGTQTLRCQDNISALMLKSPLKSLCYMSMNEPVYNDWVRDLKEKALWLDYEPMVFPMYSWVDWFGRGGWKASDIVGDLANRMGIKVHYGIPDFWVANFMCPHTQSYFRSLLGLVAVFNPIYRMIGDTLHIIDRNMAQAGTVVIDNDLAFEVTQTDDIGQRPQRFVLKAGHGPFNMDYHKGPTVPQNDKPSYYQCQIGNALMSVKVNTNKSKPFTTDNIYLTENILGVGDREVEEGYQVWKNDFTGRRGFTIEKKTRRKRYSSGQSVKTVLDEHTLYRYSNTHYSWENPRLDSGGSELKGKGDPWVRMTVLGKMVSWPSTETGPEGTSASSDDTDDNKKEVYCPIAEVEKEYIYYSDSEFWSNWIPMSRDDAQKAFPLGAMIYRMVLRYALIMAELPSDNNSAREDMASSTSYPMRRFELAKLSSGVSLPGLFRPYPSSVNSLFDLTGRRACLVERNVEYYRWDGSPGYVQKIEVKQGIDSKGFMRISSGSSIVSNSMRTAPRRSRGMDIEYDICRKDAFDEWYGPIWGTDPLNNRLVRDPGLEVSAPYMADWVDADRALWHIVAQVPRNPFSRTYSFDDIIRLPVGCSVTLADVKNIDNNSVIAADIKQNGIPPYISQVTHTFEAGMAGGEPTIGTSIVISGDLGNEESVL